MTVVQSGLGLGEIERGEDIRRLGLRRLRDHLRDVPARGILLPRQAEGVDLRAERSRRVGGARERGVGESARAGNALVHLSLVVLTSSAAPAPRVGARDEDLQLEPGHVRLGAGDPRLVEADARIAFGQNACLVESLL